MSNFTFKIYTLGCKVNQYDSSVLAQQLIEAGWQLVDYDAQAAIVNTCAVTKQAIYKSKRTIKKARQQNPKAKIILMGCWPQTHNVDPNEAGVDLVWGVGDLKNLTNKVNKLLKNEKTSHSLPKPVYKDTWCLRFLAKNRRHQVSPATLNLTYQDKARYFIKIQDGCEQFCTYCLIPFARGRLTSRAQEDILAEVKAVEQAGWQEIVLSGIHLGLWGVDSSRQENLASLLRVLVSQTSVRFRLSSIEITEVSDELIELMAKSEQICKHLHVPLQSASNKILKLMNRPYTVEFFLKRLEFIRRLIPDIAITTDVIVGFPAETEADFRATYDFIQKARFSRLHVFPFSAHDLVPASRFAGQVEKNIKQKRAQILRQLGEKLKKQYSAQFKGKILALLVERQAGDKFIGKSEYYFDVEFSCEQIIGNDCKKNSNLVGQIVKVYIK